MKKTEKVGSNQLSALDLLRDILSGEYINDLIYGHPERAERAAAALSGGAD